jgi:CelD/BcsL family acetyltransferase involved in cellulose biosynthesis
MRTRIISIRDLSPSEEEAWRDLAARSIEPNPFYEVDFLVPACCYLRNGKSVVLLVAEEAGRFYACLPVRPVKLPGILSPPMIISWRNCYGYLGTPLVAPERSVEALSSLLITLRGTGAWPRVVVLELFGEDGPIAAYLRRSATELGLTVHVHASGERPVFRCQDEKPGVPSASVKRERRARERQWRQLCRDWGDPKVVDRAGDKDSSADFLAVEASGWKGKAGTALACRGGDAAFYREMTARFGASGRLRLYSLEVGGEKLAMDTYLCVSGNLFGWKMAYDERFASYGPGAQLQLRVFDLARQDGMGWIDSCADVGNNHQLRLFPDRRRVATLVVRGQGRMEARVLRLAVLLVQVNGKLRGLSAKTLRHKLVGVPRVIGRALQR